MIQRLFESVPDRAIALKLMKFGAITFSGAFGTDQFTRQIGRVDGRQPALPDVSHSCIQSLKAGDISDRNSLAKKREASEGDAIIRRSAAFDQNAVLREPGRVRAKTKIDTLFAMPLKLLFTAFAICTFSMGQPQRTPDLEVQRTAMRKFSFLVGKWAGEARLLRGPGQWVSVVQTEEAQYKLDGLILVIEGVGRTAPGSTPLLQALAMISYDDESATYRIRAFNDGRFLESEVKLLDDGKSMTWGFSLGQINTLSTLRITDKGDWTEHTEITFGSRPAQKMMELTVSRHH